MKQPLGHIPLTLHKSIDANGQEEYRMRGKMSSTSKDDDGQYLNPSGFDMTDFMGPEGFINWHHQQSKNPLALIGKPTSYELDKANNEMWIEFKLFGNNPMAQQVWKLQEVLEEQGLGLGLSLEGGATEVKDPKTGKIISSKEAIEKKIPLTYVEKARVTGCAVTPSPKNKDSVVSLMKGHEDDFDLIKGDIIREGSGSEVGVDRHPLALESLEDEMKTLEFDSETGAFKTDKRQIPKEYHTKGRASVFLKKCYENKTSPQLLSKSQVFAVLGKILPLNTVKFEEIFNFTLNLEKGNKNMETTVEQKVSSNTLAQALQELEVLTKGTQEEPVIPETAPAVQQVEIDAAVDARLSTLEKGMETLILLATQNLQKGNMETETKEEEKGDEEKEKKAEPAEDEKKENELEKGLVTATLTSETIGESPVSLIKGFLSEQKTQVESFMTQATELIKGQNQTIEDMKETIDDMSKETLGRKSISTKNYLQKGNEGLETEMNVLSVSRDKRQILDTLMPMAMNDGGIISEQLSKAIMQFEQGNIVTQQLTAAVKSAGFTLIQ